MKFTNNFQQEVKMGKIFQFIIHESSCSGKKLWQILADFVADFVAGSTKPLDYQGVLRV